VIPGSGGGYVVTKKAKAEALEEKETIGPFTSDRGIASQGEDDQQISRQGL